MTPKQQRKFYFPNWHTACVANGWRVVKGRLETQKSEVRSQKSELTEKVIAAAQRMADGKVRALTLDDLRHGVHVVALGRDKSSSKLTNTEIDRVVAMFRLLADETDLDAEMKLSNPDIGERQRLVVRINSLAPFAVVNGVCQRAFAPVYSEPFWEDLPLVNLRALTGILQEIRERKNAGVSSQQSVVSSKEPELADCPY